MFSLDTKALNKRLYHCVIRQLKESHTDDRDYETFLYILCTDVPALLKIIHHIVQTCSATFFFLQEKEVLLCFFHFNVTKETTNELQRASGIHLHQPTHSLHFKNVLLKAEIFFYFECEAWLQIICHGY